jgi:hypothetical protein
MPKLQKPIEKVFAEIAETSKKKGKYSAFLNIDAILGLNESEELRELKEMYDSLTSGIRDQLIEIAAIEEIIYTNPRKRDDRFRIKIIFVPELHLRPVVIL